MLDNSQDATPIHLCINNKHNDDGPNERQMSKIELCFIKARVYILIRHGL